MEVEARNLTHPPAPISHRERGQRDVSYSPSIKDVTAQTVRVYMGGVPSYSLVRGSHIPPNMGYIPRTAAAGCPTSRATAHVTAGVGSGITRGHVGPRDAA